MSSCSRERIGRFGVTSSRSTPRAAACRWLSSLRASRGFSAVLLTIGLTALIGMGAVCVDVGHLIMASNIAQDAADAAAFAGGSVLKYPADAIQAALQTIVANNATSGGFDVTCQYIPESANSDIIYYAAGTTVPGVGPLGMYAKALVVKTHITVPYTFARVLGLTQKEIMRQSTVIRAPVGGCPIAPLWVSHPTEYRYGEYQNLLMADGPHCAGIPGNFGWLSLPADCTASWSEVLAGLPLSDQDVESLFVDIGDSVYGYPGLSVGQWVAGLEARIERAVTGPWASETFDTCSPNNPRIIIIPLVSYVSGTGSGATFRIEKFGAFWIDSASASGNPKHIDGRFIRYTLPGAGIEPLSDDVGLFTYRLAG